eukprot:COSAG02_NODE_21488_length_786_cov_1.080058_1_plen_72_part_10
MSIYRRRTADTTNTKASQESLGYTALHARESERRNQLSLLISPDSFLDVKVGGHAPLVTVSAVLTQLLYPKR